jgi:hypothetical protein
MNIEMIREGDLLFLVVDDEQVLQRKNGQWAAAVRDGPSNL